jgi:hypothetical protein
MHVNYNIKLLRPKYIPVLQLAKEKVSQMTYLKQKVPQMTLFPHFICTQKKIKDKKARKSHKYPYFFILFERKNQKS